MVQEILTYLTISIATIIAIQKIVKTFIPKNNRKTQVAHGASKGCGSCSADCMVRDKGLTIATDTITYKKRRSVLNSF